MSQYLYPPATNAPTWTVTGTSGINDAGAIIGVATSSADNQSHGVLLLPCQFRLLNGDTNAASVDGMDFSGNRPTVVSATVSYATSALVSEDTAANGGFTNIGVLPLCGSSYGAPTDGYVYSLMMLAKVSPPTATNITYGWRRVYLDQSLTISKTSTNTWYVNEAYGSATTPQEDTGSGVFRTTVPSTNNNVVAFTDCPGMALSFFNSGAPRTNDYAYEKTAFTYFLTNSIGSTNAVASQQLGQIIVAKRTGTSGTDVSDWTGESNIVSTTNIPNCLTVSTNEIKAIVYPSTNQVIFDPSVPSSP